MRITKEQKQENYDRIIATASELFRERGFDGVGVAELMEGAGLTHGGFYNHFRSKEELIAESTENGLDETLQRYAGYDVLDVMELYLARDHRDGRGQGCTAAALSCDAARQPETTKAVFAAGIDKLVRAVEGGIAQRHASGAGGRAQAIAILAQAVGAIVLSRACPDDSPLADELLDACRADCRDAIENRMRQR
ncbi:TetR family transcriptional regulator [Rhizobium phaseoli]|uniref:TetR/AcrR family transcriptional regulator n=1 Tax=Rhizobium phaseoli TaxID=396 RepID=UPI0002F0D911|nr:TetR/AcrR family transcriptional regulator [Rhizobium phaseoli]KKZ87911.1 TetR family transcriptional regulator [Rhizobium phaseoli Ch24-10]RDJ17377.1 TetR family transcriptional regulator [Rhizobium phaseoli]RDJ18643.1 TetR family transcriptional regulator [Rhizobium phaseoli]